MKNLGIFELQIEKHHAYKKTCISEALERSTVNPEILDRTSNLTDAIKLPEKADAINRKER